MVVAEGAGSTEQHRRKAPMKGAPARPAAHKSVCSIPAKYETILYTGPRERKGFGSEGRRFGTDETDNPGPGTYACTSCPFAQPSAESTSKKGSFPQASRFRHRIRYSGPGPGAYAVKKEAFQAATCSEAAPIGAHPTSSFHPKVKKVKDVYVTRMSPGPGSYSPEETRTGQKLDLLANPATGASAFRSGVGHKLLLVHNPDIPAPTQYDPWPVGSGKGVGSGGSKACSSSFAGRSIGSLATVPPIVFLEEPGSSGAKPATGPGPGSYQVMQCQSMQTSLNKAAVKPSPAFRQAEYTDRFGKPLMDSTSVSQRETLCVGQLGAGATAGAASASDATQQVASSLSATRAVSAPFKSKAAAHGDYDLREVARAPGPAFYSPTLPAPRKSYHLNARKAFVQS